MAVPLVTLELSQNDLARLPQALASKAERAVRRTAALIEAQAVRNAPERTSNLINSITTVISGSAFDTEARIKATAGYALFVHEGTGIFGETGQPIRPKNAKALAFEINGQLVFRKSVKGMKGRPFLKQAFEQKSGKLAELLFE